MIKQIIAANSRLDGIAQRTPVLRSSTLNQLLGAEPSDVLGLAALLQKSIAPGSKTWVILSGGNMDPDTLSTILNKS